MDIHYSYLNQRCLWRLWGNDAEGSQIYQRILFCEPLRPGVICNSDDEQDGNDRSNSPDDLSWTDDGTLLCSYWNDLRKDTYKTDQRNGWSDEDHPLPVGVLCYCRTGITWTSRVKRICC